MKTSTDRILTTHVGSLPRPLDLFDMLTAEDQNQPHDAAALEKRVAEAVKDVVAKQVACGVDIVSDGDMGKISYTFYVKHRLSNIDPAAPPGAEILKRTPIRILSSIPSSKPVSKNSVVAGDCNMAARGWLAPLPYTNDAPLNAGPRPFAGRKRRQQSDRGLYDGGVARRAQQIRA